MAAQNRLGFAIQLNVLGAGGPEIYDVDSDPNGTAAQIGSLALRRDVGQAWLNVGGTTWTQLSDGGLHNPIPTDVVLGFGDASEGEIVYYNTDEWLTPFFFDVLLLGRKSTLPYSFADDAVEPFGKYGVVVAAPGSVVSSVSVGGGGHVYGGSALLLGGDVKADVGTADITGGGVLIQAGKASGAAGVGVHTGGKVEIYGGRGDDAGGDVYIQSGPASGGKTTAGDVDIVAIQNGRVRIASQGEYVRLGALLPGDRGLGRHPSNASVWAGEISVVNGAGSASVVVGSDMTGLVVQASFYLELTGAETLALGGEIVFTDDTPTATLLFTPGVVKVWETTTCLPGITYTANQNFQISVAILGTAEDLVGTLTYVLTLLQTGK